VIELNEAFAAQGLAVLRDLGTADDGDHVNPNGGAIASAIRSACRVRASPDTAALELQERGGKLALATMCIGVGQGIAMRAGAGVSYIS
jgi:acetyl-CoA acyltransferase